MQKFIVRAKDRNTNIGLMMNTSSVNLDHVVWDADSIRKCEDYRGYPCVRCKDDFELEDFYEKQDWHSIDNAIMDSDVPTGGMVVIADETYSPRKGWICCNGNEWIRIYLNDEIAHAIVNMIHPDKYVVNAGMMLHAFDTQEELVSWLKTGVEATEGSEHHRLVGMLLKAMEGNRYITD